MEATGRKAEMEAATAAGVRGTKDAFVVVLGACGVRGDRAEVEVRVGWLNDRGEWLGNDVLRT